jgi:uncharacterized membrane protein YoaT (DUF817 family)
MMVLQHIWHLFKLGSSAAIFGILLLLAFVITHQMIWPIAGIYRYDALLAYALLIQVVLIYWKLETPREVLVIAVFHVMAMVMELFLTHPKIGSWHYPESGIFRIANVPLFAGFMYSAVGSFLARSLRLLQVSFERLPSLKWLGLFALLAYANFFTKFVIPDIRNGLFIASIILFYKTKLIIQLNHSTQQIAFLPVLLFLAFLVWLAENVATFANIWRYPSQFDQWHWVGWGKLGSWYLLLSLSLVLVLMVMGQRDKNGQWRLITDKY